MRSFVLMLFLGLMASSSAFAQAQKGKLPLDLGKPGPDVAGQIQQIRADLAEGKLYSEIEAAKRAEVVQALDRISATIDRNQGRELSKADQVSLSNDQELVNVILTRAKEDSRMVCRRERAIGSNMITSQCMTVAQRREAQRRSQQDMNDVQRRSRLD
ncbi:hypothetical protein [[Pseudomonas] boreopolis]|uniref:Uncharacterized protein n=1 Tax=Xanthomonas boreopolis TaxID=86183 RepID=A0A919F6A1_9XANT|nr:hypothetical protein GCM10009090_09300 [[Pseudomonas] boreopolis]